MPASDRLAEPLLDLAWSCWTELGASGWARRHADWWIDPEPLVALTARLTPLDTRLRDESIDWCVRYGRYLSVTRLRNLWRTLAPEPAAALSSYAATVAAHRGFAWPHPAPVHELTPSGRSRMDDFARPALVGLRLRALLGVGARAEIVRAVAARPERAASAADLAPETGYAKRNVAEELDSLRRGGLLAVTPVRNQLRYRAASRDRLATVVGPTPAVFPPWPRLQLFLDDLLALTIPPQSKGPELRAVEASRLLRRHAELLAGVDPPPPVPADRARLWPTFEDWSLDLVARWARGEPAGLQFPPNA